MQPEDGKIQLDILTCHSESLTHELFQIPEIPCHICKLSADCAADFLCRMLSALGKCEILFSGTFVVSSWQLKTITFTRTVNHVLQLFSCFIQKRDVLRITYVCRCTGCIKGQRSFVCIFFCSTIITIFPPDGGVWSSLSSSL